MIESYIKSETATIEKRCNLAIMPQTWDVFLDYTEVAEYLELFKFPMTSITSIKYYDTDNEEQTVDAGDYTTIITGRPTQIIFDDVPSVYERSDAMTIRFVAGFTNLEEINDIILAIKQRVFKIYNNPGDFVEEKLSYFDKVIRDYRVYEE